MRKSTEMDKYRAQAMASTGNFSTNVMLKDGFPSFCVGDFLIFKVNKHRLNMHCVLLFFVLMELENDDFQIESPLPGIARIDFHQVFCGVSSCLSTRWTQIFSFVVPFLGIWLAIDFASEAKVDSASRPVDVASRV